MTKYILHGGYTSTDNFDNNTFFEEITRDLTGSQLILLNYFSREKNEYEKLAKQDSDRILKHSINKDLQFEIADPDQLTEQLGRANVMYMRGGDTALLLNLLRQTPDLPKLFMGKVIAGSSAGAYALVKYSWDWNKEVEGVRPGLGLLPLKIICHYTEARRPNLVKLSQIEEDLPILKLADFKWAVFYIWREIHAV